MKHLKHVLEGFGIYKDLIAIIKNSFAYLSVLFSILGIGAVALGTGSAIILAAAIAAAGFGIAWGLMKLANWSFTDSGIDNKIKQATDIPINSIMKFKDYNISAKYDYTINVRNSREIQMQQKETIQADASRAFREKYDWMTLMLQKDYPVYE